MDDQKLEKFFEFIIQKDENLDNHRERINRIVNDKLKKEYCNQALYVDDFLRKNYEELNIELNYFSNKEKFRIVRKILGWLHQYKTIKEEKNLEIKDFKTNDQYDKINEEHKFF